MNNKITTETSISKESIPPCWVCGKIWQRKDTDKYGYFQGIVICLNHKYAKKWHNAAIRLAEEKIKKEVLK
ncbi:MAG: hypothetical protein KKF27_20405 [Gammaproteobacteria bacterium]|nr:hypothetical protein [Gammaproteobacteria bacterium]MBU2685610.1 hypothetical protein [Gammaproteobacteria bacterium]